MVMLALPMTAEKFLTTVQSTSEGAREGRPVHRRVASLGPAQQAPRPASLVSTSRGLPQRTASGGTFMAVTTLEKNRTACRNSTPLDSDEWA